MGVIETVTKVFYECKVFVTYYNFFYEDIYGFYCIIIHYLFIHQLPLMGAHIILHYSVIQTIYVCNVYILLMIAKQRDLK